MKSNEGRFEILDCTIRDGGYLNNWNFDVKVVRETYRATSKAGVDYVEIGYHGTEKYFDRKKFGRARFSTMEFVHEICEGIEGAPVSIMVDFGKFDVEALEQYRDSPVALIRIAAHKDKLAMALDAGRAIKDMGFKVAVQLMGFSSYSDDDMRRLPEMLSECDVDYIYIADSYGSILPDQLRDMCSPFAGLSHFKLGFHPHNNLQMAFANSLAAVDTGAQIIDGSVFGMGRGAGNLPLEIMLTYLYDKRPVKYNPIPVLNLIDRYYQDLNRKHRWGYSLAYMLSGVSGCHPSYAKNLLDRREFTIEDMWNIFDIIKSGDTIGFDASVLDKVLSKGLFKSKMGVEAPSSFQRGAGPRTVEVPYEGRHAGKDFLVLATGPNLRSHRKQIAEFITKYNPIILGANYLGGLFVPQYHAFTNTRRFVDYVDSVHESSKLLVGQYIPEETIRDYVARDYERIYYDDVADTPFGITDGVIDCNCKTVAILLTAVAAVMEAKRIFIVGLDGYIKPDGRGSLHFYDEPDEPEDLAILHARHLGNLRYLEEIDTYLCSSGKEGLHILTPTNYSRFYKGIDNYI